MQQYSYLQGLFSSFYSAAFYRDVRHNWGAGVFIFLLQVLAICWAINMVPIQATITRSFEKVSKDIVPQFPNVIIMDGITITPLNRPYIIRDLKTKEKLLVIDTSGHYNTLAQANARVLLTKKNILIKNSSNETRIEQLPKKLNIHIFPTEMKKTIEIFVSWAWLTVYPVVLFLSFVYRILQALLCAVVGKLVCLMTGVSLNFSQLVQLSIVSLAPSILSATFLSFLHVSFYFQPLFHVFLILGYLFFAIQANKKRGLE